MLLLVSSGNLIGQDRAAEPEQQEGQEAGAEKPEGFWEHAVAFLFKHHERRFFGRPHTVNVLPIAYYHFRTGLILGFRAVIQSKERQPYLYRLKFQILASLKGSHKHKAVFDYPRIIGSRYGLRMRAEWERDLQARYFGLGNDSIRNTDLINKGSEKYIDDEYYLYNFKRPRINVHVTREFLRNVFLWVGAGAEYARPQLKDGPEMSFIGQDRPFGFLGGSGWFLSFRLHWDTRDNDVFPNKGFITSFSFQPNFAKVDDISETSGGLENVSRSLTFQRYTFSSAHFISLRSGRLLFANRVAFESISGDAPYYAFGDLAGEKLTRVVGGSQSLRGFKSRRFQDKVRCITLTELRFKYTQFKVMSSSFDVIFLGFFDNGRVWPSFSDITIDNFHSSFGFGAWLNWNESFIIRLEVGKSSEGWQPLFRFGSSF